MDLIEGLMWTALAEV